MPGGHIACLTVQIFLVIWKKKGKAKSSLLYHSTIYTTFMLQINGIDGGGAQFHGLGRTFLLLFEFLLATDMFRGQGLYIDY